MAEDVENIIRGPQAYTLAGKALQLMRDAQVWPTPLNYELWLRYAAEPDGALGRAIADLLEYKTPITEAVSEQLAIDHLPRGALGGQVRDLSDVLSRELAQVSAALDQAQKNQAAYGRTLAGASDAMDGSEEAPAFKQLVDSLAAATKKVQSHSKALEQRLSESTSEVEALRDRLEEARRDATTDGLTQLANRKSFDEHFAKLRDLSVSGRGSLTLALLDIDHFKKINDTSRHQTGDQVLRFVASVLAKTSKTPRFAARYGGEEFAILFPGEHPTQVMAALDEIRLEIASRVLKRRSTNEDLGAVTISMGVATLRPGEKTAALTERADAALYASKRNGRNRVTSADTLPAAA
ncbi:MAG: GGDEF domain-containing protein [Pseudomonadota bacterium]|nr:GGDEF domain-containing protein [Pseudomonadota bacterium]